MPMPQRPMGPPQSDPMAQVEAGDQEQAAALTEGLAQDIPTPDAPLTSKRVGGLYRAMESAKTALGIEAPTTIDVGGEDFEAVPPELWRDIVAMAGAIDALSEAGVPSERYADYDPATIASSDEGLRDAELMLTDLSRDPAIKKALGGNGKPQKKVEVELEAPESENETEM